MEAQQTFDKLEAAQNFSREQFQTKLNKEDKMIGEASKSNRSRNEVWNPTLELATMFEESLKKSVATGGNENNKPSRKKGQDRYTCKGLMKRHLWSKQEVGKEKHRDQVAMLNKVSLKNQKLCSIMQGA